MDQQQTRRRANTVIGAALVAFGTLFLIGRVFDLNMGSFIWPFFIILPGLAFFVGMVKGGKSAGPLAIPGSIVTMTGLILLYNSVFDALFNDVWASMAYMWALIFPTSVGIGMIIAGSWSETPALVKKGYRWTMVGMGIFLTFGVFFELLLNITDSPVSDVLWPGLLIGLGVWLLRRKHTAAEVPAVDETPRREADAPSNGTHARKALAAPPAETASGPEFEPLDPSRGRK